MPNLGQGHTIPAFLLPVAEFAPGGPFATIVRRGGSEFSYELTPDDVFWATKMAIFEGRKDVRDVLWTMAQRFVSTYPVQRWKSFAHFIREYSQPINPDWARSGKFCREGGKYASQDSCSEERLAKRDRIAKLSWADLLKKYPEPTQLTLDWAMGRLHNRVPRAIHFAVPGVSERWMTRNPGGKIVKRGGNWFLATASSSNWRLNHVIIRGPTGLLARAAPETPVGEAFAIATRSLLRPIRTPRRLA